MANTSSSSRTNRNSQRRVTNREDQHADDATETNRNVDPVMDCASGWQTGRIGEVLGQFWQFGISAV
ncbi:hypothetical protein M8J75_007636 [Diaphorina citri]|nr:hypothetical protein M8J75_007636 [Diaphorina citri]